jgi:hypothetical protein
MQGNGGAVSDFEIRNSKSQALPLCRYFTRTMMSCHFLMMAW